VSATALFGEDASILEETDLQFLLGGTLLPVLGTALVSPVLDSLIDPLGVSPASVGWMISVYTAPAIVLIPVAGMLADRYGRKVVLTSSIVLFGVGGTAIAFTTDFHVVLFFRFLQGVGFAGINPIIITSLGDMYEGGEEETAQGLRFMASGFSGAVFPLFAGVLVVMAWQYPFLLYALAFPIALGVYLWFDEPTTSGTATVIEDDESASYTRLLIDLCRQRRVLTIVIARSLMIPAFIGFVTYNSLIVVRLLGGTPVQAGILTAIAYLSFAASASQAGRITSLFESRLYPLIGSNLSLSLGLSIVLFAPSIGVATVGIIAIGAGFGILGSLYRSIITGFAPQFLRAGLVGLSESGGRITATLTPLVMGGIIGFASPAVGLPAALQLAGLVVAFGGGGVAITCLLIANAASPVSVDYPDPADA